MDEIPLSHNGPGGKVKKPGGFIVKNMIGIMNHREGQPSQRFSVLVQVFSGLAGGTGAGAENSRSWMI